MPARARAGGVMVITRLSAATVAIAAPRRLAEDFDDGLAFKSRARPIGHFDLPEVTSVTPEIDTQIATRSDPPIHPKILLVTIEVDEPHRHHVHVTAIGTEAERPEGSVPIPVL